MLTQEQFDRADTALGHVIENAPEFTDRQVDFALVNGDRLSRYGRHTNLSERQWVVIEKIEAQIKENEE